MGYASVILKEQQDRLLAAFIIFFPFCTVSFSFHSQTAVCRKHTSTRALKKVEDNICLHHLQHFLPFPHSAKCGHKELSSHGYYSDLCVMNQINALLHFTHSAPIPPILWPHVFFQRLNEEVNFPGERESARGRGCYNDVIRSHRATWAMLEVCSLLTKSFVN